MTARTVKRPLLWHLSILTGILRRMARERDERSYMVDGLVPAHEDGGPPLGVVPESLCTRCGICDPICPTDVVRFDDRAFPVIETEGCIACGLCVVVCPGVDFDYKAEYWKRFGVAEPPRWRHLRERVALHVVARREGSGGGVVTQILMGLLAEGEIDAAVTVGADPEDPLKPQPVVCRTPEELLATAGSKYCVVPQAKALRQVRRLPGRFAFVGVGCQVEGLRRLEGFNKSLARRKILTIGLACHGTLEREATTDLLERKRVPLGSVVRFRYRGGTFPGKFQAELPGEVRDLHRYEYKDSAYNYLFHLYTPQRCLDCPDFTAEFTDLSVTDFWVRDEHGEYLHPEDASLVLCRNERAEALLHMLIANGHLVGGLVSKDNVDRSFRHLDHEKRVAPFLRWERARHAGRFAPNYHLDPPAVTLTDRAWEALFRTTFVFSRWRSTRRMMVWVLFSRFCDAVTWVNMSRKRRRARRRARREGDVSQFVQFSAADSLGGSEHSKTARTVKRSQA